MPNSVKQFSSGATSRINADATGISGVIIEAILAVVMPLLLERLKGCISQSQPTEAQLRAKLQQQWDRDPKTVREVTAKDVMKAARKRGDKITKAQALQMADGAIMQALATPAIDWSLI